MFPDCEPGVVPPFGRLYGLTTLVDSGFSEIGDIVVSANTRHEGLWMHFRDFAAIEEPEQASFSRPIVAWRQARRIQASATKTAAPDRRTRRDRALRWSLRDRLPPATRLDR